MVTHQDEAVFEVRMTGLSLSLEQQKIIGRAIRSAAMAELAKLDFRDQLELRSLRPHGGTDGVVIKKGRE